MADPKKVTGKKPNSVFYAGYEKIRSFFKSKRKRK
jgi:hypothetical protein